MTDSFSPNSSLVTGASYNSDTKELEVTLTGGNRYRYSDVPASVWDDFKNAPSTGRAFNLYIKDSYRFRAA